MIVSISSSLASMIVGCSGAAGMILLHLNM
jgi:hypothetical protein